MKKVLFFALLVTLLISINAEDKKTNSNDLDRLIEYMTGSFSSLEQSKTDTNFFDIHLQMVRIWPEKDDAIYLYIEQAASWALEKPYRQRIYKVTQIDEETFSSAVYTFENPLNYAGCYKNPESFNKLKESEIEEREGCSIILKKTETGFAGSTVKTNCVSNLRGSKYATSEVVIEKTFLQSWDRGFDEAGKQIWGAVTGPYIFKKNKF